jgi:phage shock protein E
MRTAIVATCVALAFGTTACTNKDSPSSHSSQSATTSDLPDRDPALAHRLVVAGALLLDVRTPAEYADRHIDGAANLPVDELRARPVDVDKLTGGDRDKPIVVYCGSGKRAARAKQVLVEAGYRHVTNLGGIEDWDRQ